MEQKGSYRFSRFDQSLFKARPGAGEGFIRVATVPRHIKRIETAIRWFERSATDEQQAAH